VCWKYVNVNVWLIMKICINIKYSINVKCNEIMKAIKWEVRINNDNNNNNRNNNKKIMAIQYK